MNPFAKRSEPMPSPLDNMGPLDLTVEDIVMQPAQPAFEALLEVLAQRIGDSHQALGTMAERLMSLGDEATGRLGGVTREFDSSSERLVRHGQALDQAAEAARTDIAVLLDDLPRAEATARAVAEQLRSVGSESA